LNGGQDHMAAYQGRGQTLNLGSDPNNPVGSVLWDSSSYLLSWEDTDLNNSDSDYNDMIVVVSNLQPAPNNFVDNVQPIPDAFATLGLLGMATIGLVILRNASAIQRKQLVKKSARFKF
jgi:hypothetical protein